MKLTAQENRILARVVHTLRGEFGATRVDLYGSAARGDMDEGSDIDLMVVLPTVNWEIEKKIAHLCLEAQLECNRVVSTVCFSEQELRDTPLRSSPLVLNVRREGMAL
jgi:predicted nucleotidyltransferase